MMVERAGVARPVEKDRHMASLKLLIVEDDIASLDLMAEVFHIT